MHLFSMFIHKMGMLVTKMVAKQPLHPRHLYILLEQLIANSSVVASGTTVKNQFCQKIMIHESFVTDPPTSYKDG